ncbi:MAG: DUF2541 family protein [Alphaproteobacteria bacterium]
MCRILGLFAIVVAAAGASLPASAQQGTLLGTRAVADHSDTDVIQVPGGARYNAVRLCVEQRSVHFQDIDVHFGNGGSQDVIVRLLVNPGECTRWINLNGPSRNITRIVLHYDMIINAGQQAVVSVYGS